jgi:hypothetical protein
LSADGTLAGAVASRGPNLAVLLPRLTYLPQTTIGLGYLINSVWLLHVYQANAWAFRRAEDVTPLLPIGFGAQFVACVAFAYAYEFHVVGLVATMLWSVGSAERNLPVVDS